MEIYETDNILTEPEKLIFEQFMPEDMAEINSTGVSRRLFLKLMALTGGGMLIAQTLGAKGLLSRPYSDPTVIEAGTSILENSHSLSLKINNTVKEITVDSRMTLLDAIREKLSLTGTKKGCDHGQCGACTIIVDNKRILSCLTLAVTCESKMITTIEGLGKQGELHPLQEAFLEHDSYQCGFCTPGQLCSAVALLTEIKNGDASYLTANFKDNIQMPLSRKEIRERMSGNLCRCGAYPNIVEAIEEILKSTV